MPYVLLLISARTDRAVSPDIVSRVNALEGIEGTADWLEKDVACEFALKSGAGQAIEDLVTAVCTLIGRAPVDAAIVPTAGRRKKLLLADMDSTFIGQECIDEVGAMSGRGDEIIAITERAMRGELDFEEALKARVSLMKGVSYDVIERVKTERITFTPGGRTAVQTMARHGTYTALVSGGFADFTGFVAEKCGFDGEHANGLIVKNGKLSGEVAEPILGRDTKLKLLHTYCAKRNIEAGDVIAVGDGANDVDMLQAAGLGVAFHPKPIVAEIADVVIRHADLTALLFLQGYRAAEFAQ